MILRKRKQHMLEMIEMQAGRIRHDFIARLSENKQQFHREMVRKMRSTLEGISTALENGMQQRAHGEKEVAQRQSDLSEELLKVDALREHLLTVREAINGM